MRRLKSILLLLGVLLLGGAISVIFVGRQHRRSWAQTLAQTEIEREALFDLRDALDVDLDAVARLRVASLKRIGPPVRPYLGEDWHVRASIDSGTSWSDFAGWRPSIKVTLPK